MILTNALVPLRSGFMAFYTGRDEDEKDGWYVRGDGAVV